MQVQETAPEAGRGQGPTDDDMLALGRLQFLAAYCPLHKTYSAALLSRLFFPAINNDCVRFFENADKKICAALIWARLDEDAADRMIHGGMLPDDTTWSSGDMLWFIDLLAPFGHGRSIARHIARNPPDEPFCFARLNAKGKVHKIVEGDRNAGDGDRLRAFVLNSKGAG